MEPREQLLKMIREGDQEALSNYIEEAYHINIAELLDDLEDEDLFRMIRMLSCEDMALIVEQCEPDQQRRFVDHLDTFALVEVFSFMSTDDVADILGIMPTKRRKDILQYMRFSDRQNIQMILSYDEDTAGGMMTTEFVALKSSLTCREAIEKVREIADDIEVIDSIFITDGRHHLIGYAPFKDILASSDEIPLSELMYDHVITIHPEEDREEASRLVTKYDLTALPVVNRNNQILGIITVDDIIDAINEEHDEDVLTMSGVARAEEVSTGALESVRYRLPYLLYDLIYGFILLGILLLFRETMREVIFLAAIAPMIARVTSDTGQQTLSVVMTNLDPEDLRHDEIPLFLFRELLVGLIHGLVLGLISGVVLFILRQNLALSVIVLVSMVISFTFTHGIATLIPLTLRKLGRDPAASRLFVTALSEIAGFVVFLGLSTLLLGQIV